MLIYKDEIHIGDLRNVITLIYSTEGFSTYLWIKKIIELVSKIETSGMIYKVLQYYILECSTKFLIFYWKILEQPRNVQIVLFPSR